MGTLRSCYKETLSAPLTDGQFSIHLQFLCLVQRYKFAGTINDLPIGQAISLLKNNNSDVSTSTASIAATARAYAVENSLDYIIAKGGLQERDGRNLGEADAEPGFPAATRSLSQ